MGYNSSEINKLWSSILVLEPGFEANPGASRRRRLLPRAFAVSTRRKLVRSSAPLVGLSQKGQSQKGKCQCKSFMNAVVHEMCIKRPPWPVF